MVPGETIFTVNGIIRISSLRTLIESIEIDVYFNFKFIFNSVNGKTNITVIIINLIFMRFL